MRTMPVSPSVGASWVSYWICALVTAAALPSAALFLCLQAAVSKASALSSHSKVFLATMEAKKKILNNENGVSAVTRQMSIDPL